MRLLLLLAFLYAAPILAQDVVINKYQNGNDPNRRIGDIVEILVIKDGLDLRGYVLRDFAVNDATKMLTTDPATLGSGIYRFNNIPEWSRLRAGTLLVLPATTDLPQKTDTVWRVGLDDSYYFRTEGSFNIAASDMVMLKRPDAPVGGTEGCVHAFSAGLTIANVSGITPLLRTSDDANTAKSFAVPDNIKGDITDYNGNRAGTVASATFGVANNAANQRFIDSLRRLRAPVTSVERKDDGPVLYRVRLAPMPASKDCEVSFRLGAADTVIISLIDMLGNSQQLYHFYHTAGDQSVRVSLANVAQGSYFLAIKTNKAEWRERISVVK